MNDASAAQAAPGHRPRPRAVPQSARVRRGGARQARPQRLGLSDRRRRDRDHRAAQPSGARFARVPAARAARRQRHRHQHDVPRPQDRDAGGARADRQHRALRSERLRRRRRRRRHLRLPDVPELGGQARHRGDRQGRAERPEDLPALRARRPGLGRGDLRPRGQGGLRRALPHRRHPSLQPPRARHLQALSRRVVARSGRLAPSEGARLGAGRQVSRRSTSCRSSSRASPPPRTPSSRSSTAST